MKVVLISDYGIVTERMRKILQQISPNPGIPETGSPSAAASTDISPDIVVIDLQSSTAGSHILRSVRSEDATWESQHVRVSSVGTSPAVSLDVTHLIPVGDSGAQAAVSGHLHHPPVRLSSPIEIKPLPVQESSPNVSPASELTNRQRQVLHLIVKGKPNKQIARELGLAVGTVRCHVSAVLRALCVTNRAEVASASGMLTFQNDFTPPRVSPPPAAFPTKPARAAAAG